MLHIFWTQGCYLPLPGHYQCDCMQIRAHTKHTLVLVAGGVRQ